MFFDTKKYGVYNLRSYSYYTIKPRRATIIEPNRAPTPMNLPAINLKKALLIIVFVIVIAGVGYLLYSFFFKSSTPSSQIETPISENNPGNGLPQSGTGTGTTTENGSNGLPAGGSESGSGENNGQGPNSATNNQPLASNAASPAVSQNGSLNFYNSLDNRFYSLDNQGKLVTLSDKQFYNVKNVTWSAVGQKAIIEYPDGSKIRYDFDRKNQVTLPKHWEDFRFSPDGDQIVAKSMGLDPNNRWLIVANDDGSKAKQIEDLGENADQVIPSWSPNGQSIAFFVDGTDFDRKEVYFIGQNGENFKSASVEGRGFDPLWTPNGQQLVYSVYSSTTDYNPTLWISDAQGDSIGANRRPLNLSTWASKCTFSGSDLYCAVPNTLERGSGLFGPDKFTTQDSLYKIDLSTGLKRPIVFDGNYSMNHLSVSPDGSYIYFIDSANNQLRKIKIR